MTGLADGRSSSALCHRALLYRDDAEFAARTTTFVRAALADRRPVLVAVPQPHLDLIRSALGSSASPVRFVDLAESGRNPGRIIPSVLLAFADEHRGQSVSIVEEPLWPGRSPAEYAAAVEHEALINLALADVSATIVCPYDAVRLPHAALDHAGRTHPQVSMRDGFHPSPDYTDPVDVAGTLSARLPPRPAEATGAAFGASDLRSIRRLIGEAAHAAGLNWQRIADLQHAVNELLTNTVVHTRRPGDVYCWQDEDTFVCEVCDSGRIDDPLVGRRLPRADQSTGRGLLLVNHLCDLVQLSSSEAGTTVRLHMLLKPSEVLSRSGQT